MSRRVGGGPSATQQPRMNFSQGGGKKYQLVIFDREDVDLVLYLFMKFVMIFTMVYDLFDPIFNVRIAFWDQDLGLRILCLESTDVRKSSE